MANFDDFKQKAKDAAETIAEKSVEYYKIAEEKTKIFAKSTKLSTEISFEKGNLRKFYTEIGRIYYANHKDNPEEVLAQVCAEATASIEKIKIKQCELDKLKTPEDGCDCGCDDDIEVEIVAEDADADDDCGCGCGCGSNDQE